MRARRDSHGDNTLTQGSSVPRDLSMFSHPRAVLLATPPAEGDPADDVDFASFEDLVPGTLVYGQGVDSPSSSWRLAKSELRPTAPSQEYRFVVPLHGAWLVAQRLDSLGVPYDVALRHGYVEAWRDDASEEYARAGAASADALTESSLLRAGVAGMLTTYQNANVGFGLTRPYVYNIWPCGSGKTLGSLVTCLATYQQQRLKGGILVVCPGKARATWEREVKKRTLIKPFRKRPDSQRKKGDQTLAEYQAEANAIPIYIYGAESLPLYIDEIQGLGPSILVIDELHQFGNMKRWEALYDDKGEVSFRARRAASGSRLALSAAGGAISRMGSLKFVVGLSATPLDDGRPRRLWSQLDMLSPGSFSYSYSRFAKRYCAARPGTYGGLEDKGSSNLKELRQRCTFFTHEVSYSQSHGELPPTRVEVEFLSRSEQRKPGRWSEDETYKQAQKRLSKMAVKGSIPKHSIVEARLAEACSRKRKFVVEEAIDGLRGNGKVLIFATRHREVEELTRGLKRALSSGESPIDAPVLMAHGGVASRERDQMVEQYRDSPGPIVMVATGDTMGTSVDGFQTTTLALLAMLPWKPGDFTQWRGRFDRLGGTATLLKVVVAEGTFDERVVEILTDKLGPIEEMLVDETVTSAKDKLLGIEDEDDVLDDILDRLL